MREGLRHTSGQFDPDAESSTGLTPARLKHAREVDNHAVRLRTSNYLPWPSPSLCLLPPDYSRLFSLLASTCFICLSLCRPSVFQGVFLSLSVCQPVCLIVKSYLEIDLSLLTSDGESLQKLSLPHSLEVESISISSLSPS